MSDRIHFRSDLPVTPIIDGCCGSDALIARAAWVIEPNKTREDEGSEAYRRVIGSMLKGRHGTPFEKGLMTVYVEAPAVVWWEWTRHRFMGLDVEDFSFSLESGRYRVLDAELYVPPKHRPCIEPAGFKPMRPKLIAGHANQSDSIRTQMQISATSAWMHYEDALAMGTAREVARMALPFSIYYAGYVEAKPRTWLQFFSLRKSARNAAHATFPQWEIEQVAMQCEDLFAQRWPLTYAAFEEHGRVSP